MSVIDIFMKKDARGARWPTVLTVVLVCVLVFVACSVSQSQTTTLKKPKVEIINERQQVEAANDYSSVGNTDSVMVANESLPSGMKKRKRRDLSRKLCLRTRISC